MNCPQCHQSLRTIEYEGIQIETCRSCGGEWLDAVELKHIVQAREVRFDENERRALASASKIKGVDLVAADRDLVCPKCGGNTDAINYGGDSGIVIDRCIDCRGLWLDGGELEQIQMLAEGWQDGIKDDLKKYGARLREVAAKVDAEDDVHPSSIANINVLINGILDIIL